MFADALPQALEGAAFALGRPLALLALLAAVLLVRDARRTIALHLIPLVVGMAVAAFWMPGRFATGAVAIELALTGGCLAAGWAPRRPLRELVLLAAGLAAGWASQLALAAPAEAVGSAAVLLVLYGLAAALLAAAWPRLPAGPAALGARVIGSWIAAVGLLMGALAAVGRTA